MPGPIEETRDTVAAVAHPTSVACSKDVVLGQLPPGGNHEGESLTIVVGDDQLLFTDVLTSVLRAAGHTVLGTASTLDELVERVGAVHPELCIIDAPLSGSDAPEVIAAILAAHPATSVVVLAADSDPGGCAVPSAPVRAAMCTRAKTWLPCWM